PPSPLPPYTTLFRSVALDAVQLAPDDVVLDLRRRLDDAQRIERPGLRLLVEEVEGRQRERAERLVQGEVRAQVCTERVLDAPVVRHGPLDDAAGQQAAADPQRPQHEVEDPLAGFVGALEEVADRVDPRVRSR